MTVGATTSVNGFSAGQSKIGAAGLAVGLSGTAALIALLARTCNRLMAKQVQTAPRNTSVIGVGSLLVAASLSAAQYGFVNAQPAPRWLAAIPLTVAILATQLGSSSLFSSAELASKANEGVRRDAMKTGLTALGAGCGAAWALTRPQEYHTVTYLNAVKYGSPLLVCCALGLVTLAGGIARTDFLRQQAQEEQHKSWVPLGVLASKVAAGTLLLFGSKEVAVDPGSSVGWSLLSIGTLLMAASWLPITSPQRWQRGRRSIGVVALCEVAATVGTSICNAGVDIWRQDEIRGALVSPLAVGIGLQVALAAIAFEQAIANFGQPVPPQRHLEVARRVSHSLGAAFIVAWTLARASPFEAAAQQLLPPSLIRRTVDLTMGAGDRLPTEPQASVSVGPPPQDVQALYLESKETMLSVHLLLWCVAASLARTISGLSPRLSEVDSGHVQATYGLSAAEPLGGVCSEAAPEAAASCDTGFFLLSSSMAPAPGEARR